MKLISKIKKLFTREKSKEALKMWDDLRDEYVGDPEFHPSLNLDAQYALSLSQEDRDRYLYDLMKRRQAARSRQIDKY